MLHPGHAVGRSDPLPSTDSASSQYPSMAPDLLQIGAVILVPPHVVAVGCAGWRERATLQRQRTSVRSGASNVSSRLPPWLSRLLGSLANPSTPNHLISYSLASIRGLLAATTLTRECLEWGAAISRDLWRRTHQPEPKSGTTDAEETHYQKISKCSTSRTATAGQATTRLATASNTFTKRDNGSDRDCRCGGSRGGGMGEGGRGRKLMAGRAVRGHHGRRDGPPT